jgi:hypothetical protein
MSTWLACAVILAASPVSTPTARVSQLSWLAGSWASDTAGTRIEEHWMAPLGGEMVGMHRDVVRGKAASFEFFRIVDEPGGFAYLSSPKGRPATRFGLKEIAARKVVFENPTHDFPQRVLYWLDEKGSLHARIEGTWNGKPESEDWEWRRDALNP